MLRRLQLQCVRNLSLTTKSLLASFAHNKVEFTRMFNSESPTNSKNLSSSYDSRKDYNNTHNGDDDVEMDLFEDDFYFLDELFDEGSADMRDFIPENDAKLLENEELEEKRKKIQ